MTDPLPPFAAPYSEEFQQLLRILERTPGFSLQPVDGPSPDLAQAFAAWAAEGGWSVEVLVLDAAGLERLPTFLTTSRVRPDPCFYLVAAGSTPGLEIEALFATLNMNRDTIIAQLRCPILWWGDAQFLRETWLHAPDLWSVAAVPFRLPYRRLQDTATLPFSLYWWTGAVQTPIPELEDELAKARQSSEPGVVPRTGLRLAEALLARKDLGGAAQLLQQLEHEVPAASSLRSRWQLLRRAVEDAAETAGADIGDLMAKLAEAEANGHQRRAVGLRLRLGPLLESRDIQMAVAVYSGARKMTDDLGDVGATLEIDMHLVYDLAPFLPAEDRERIEIHAESALKRTSDPVSLGSALLIRAKLALLKEEIHKAESLAREVLGSAESDHAGFRECALCILAQVVFLRGQYSECVEVATDWLTLAESGDNHLLMVQALSLRAEALAALDRPLDAAQDVLTAIVVESDLDWEIPLYVSFGVLAHLALTYGDSWVAASLTVAAVIGAVVLGAPLAVVCRVEPDELAFGETKDVGACLRAVIECAGSGSAERTALREHLSALQDSVRHIHDLLADQGVRELDPSTWRPREPGRHRLAPEVSSREG